MKLKAEGHGASKLSASLGMIRKDMVKMQKLLQDSRYRKVDLQHSLIQQTLGKSQHYFTLVVERIFTSCEGTIEYSGMEEGKCGGVLKALGIYPAELCLRESGNLKYDTNVAIDLPAGSVLAYSVIQLDIKTDGRYELSACFDGFQSDDESSQPSLYGEEEVVDGLSVEWPCLQKGSSLSVLKEVLCGVKASLSVLAQLPVPTRSSLLLLFRQILLKPTLKLLYCLEYKLETFCRNPSLPVDDASDKLVEDFLDLIWPHRTIIKRTSTEPVTQNGSSSPSLSNQNGVHTPATNQNGAHTPATNQNGAHTSQANQNGAHIPAANQNGAHTPAANQNAAHYNGISSQTVYLNGSSSTAEAGRPVRTALYMLVSAAEGLKDEGLIYLESLCSPEELRGLNYLVNLLTDSEKPLPRDSLPDVLQSDAQFLKVEALFRLGGVTLRREGQLWAEVESGTEFLPAVLCVVIHGLAYLSQDL
uniref:Uncharacterized LOC103037040 n=1 Tax=Astyanax mexicanus TaxID=7994 RepID=A0A3B1JE01_ASTMX